MPSIRQIMRPLVVLGAVVTGLLGVSHPGDAATLNVALNGTDTATCGATARPCRSINRAIANAQPGDKIVVAPGRYTGPIVPACDCLVWVNKAVTIESRDGAHATILDASGAEALVVNITANGATFGRSGGGFTITGTDGRGGGLFALSGNTGVVVSGNVAIGNGTGFAFDSHRDYRVTDNVATQNRSGFLNQRGRNGTWEGNTARGNDLDGFTFLEAGSSMVLDDNVALDNGTRGFSFQRPIGVELTGNVAQGNGHDGFGVDGGADVSFRINVATGNHGSGFRFGREEDGGATGIVLEDNVATGNHDAGVLVVDATALTITGNTVVGNRNGLVVMPAFAVVDARRNAFVGNAEDGVQTASTSTAVMQNNIFGNGVCGLNKTTPGF